MLPCVSFCCSPFTSDENIYKGRITVVAYVNDPADTPATSDHIAFATKEVEK